MGTRGRVKTRAAGSRPASGGIVRAEQGEELVEVDRVRPALALVDARVADGNLARCHMLHPTRAVLLRRIGAPEEAAKSDGRALAIHRRRRAREVQPPRHASSRDRRGVDVSWWCADGCAASIISGDAEISNVSPLRAADAAAAR